MVYTTSKPRSTNITLTTASSKIIIILNETESVIKTISVHDIITKPKMMPNVHVQASELQVQQLNFSSLHSSSYLHLSLSKINTTVNPTKWLKATESYPSLYKISFLIENILSTSLKTARDDEFLLANKLNGLIVNGLASKSTKLLLTKNTVTCLSGDWDKLYCHRGTSTGSGTTGGHTLFRGSLKSILNGLKEYFSPEKFTLRAASDLSLKIKDSSSGTGIGPDSDKRDQTGGDNYGKSGGNTIVQPQPGLLVEKEVIFEDPFPGPLVEVEVGGALILESQIAESTMKPTKMKEEKAVEVILKSLVAGGIAGMCAKTAVAPLDRMKILLQAHSKHYSHLGVFSGLKGIVEKESLIALYKGNGAQMVRIFPYAATQFTSFEIYKKTFGENSHIGRFAAGSSAGVTAVALTYPLDTIRARLAFQVSGEHIYNGIYQCASHIFQKEGGVRALYRGFIPTICGMIPYAGLSFYCFESFKFMCMKYFPDITCKHHQTNTGGLVLMLPFKLLSGGVAGAVAQTVSYPLDVTRRRMQLAMMDEKTKKFGMGMVSTLKIIYQENGVIRGLYRGMSINYLRAIPMVAVSFSTYELVKQLLSLDTGLPMKTG